MHKRTSLNAEAHLSADRHQYSNCLYDSLTCATLAHRIANTALLRKQSLTVLHVQIEELIDRQVGPDVRSRGRAFSRSGASDVNGVTTMYADVATALAFTWATDEQPQVRLLHYCSANENCSIITYLLQFCRRYCCLLPC
jgi:hypothetical protein